MKSSDFDEALQNHLWKSELDYRALHQEGPTEIPFLAARAGSLDTLYLFLRSLGYRNLEKVTDKDGDHISQWVQAAHFCVFVNWDGGEGFFIPSRR